MDALEALFLVTDGWQRREIWTNTGFDGIVADQIWEQIERSRAAYHNGDFDR